MNCPLCKYAPVYNKSKTLRNKEGNVAWITIDVRHDYRPDYGSSCTPIAYQCPKCGILFRRVE